MKKPISLNEVLAFPATVPLETVGFHWLSLLLLVAAVIGLFIAYRFFKNSEIMSIVGHGVFVLGIAGFMAYIIYVVPSVGAGGTDKYNAHYAEWLNDYVSPYIETLPEEKVDLSSVKYSYLLEEKSKRGVLQREEIVYGQDGVPVEVTDTKGKIHSVWAEVVYEEGLETSYMTGHQLERALSFEEAEISYYLPRQPVVEAGLKNVVLHTGNPAFEKYAKQEEGIE